MVKTNLLIRSIDRSNNYIMTPDNFQINLSRPITNISSIKLKHAIFGNTCFNVNYSNKTCRYYLGDTEYTVTLTEGYYTISSFTSMLQTQLNSSSGEFVCSYSNTLNKFTISNNDYNFIFYFDNYPRFASLLGFHPIRLSSSNTMSSSIAPLFSTPYSLFLNLSSGGNNIVTANNSLGQFYIPINCNFGEYSEFNEYSNFENKVSVTNQSFNSLYVSVVFTDGNNLQSINLVDWEALFELE